MIDVWMNPKYHPPAETETTVVSPPPPEPQGFTLAEFARDQGRSKLRVSREEFNGHEFIRAQVWEVGTGRNWWPVKGKSITVKLREVAEFSRVLGAIAASIEPPGRQGAARGPAAPTAGRTPHRGPRSQGGPPRPVSTTPPWARGDGSGGDFSEF